MRRKFLLMLGVALIATVPIKSAQADEFSKLILACNSDGTYTCGNDCTDTSKGCLYCCSSCAEQ